MRWSGSELSVAAPRSQWIACSPVRNGHRVKPLNGIVSNHMSPAAVLIVAFVVADSGVEAAVHDRAGTLASFRFTNTQQGIVALARWMDNLPSAGKYTTAHACIVSLRSDEGELYS